MDKIIERSAFENAYAGKAPWDIGKPQKPFVAAADRMASPVLDAGCGFPRPRPRASQEAHGQGDVNSTGIWLAS